MNTRSRILLPALALAASLCCQTPVLADPPSWNHQEATRGPGQDRRDDRGSHDMDHRNDRGAGRNDWDDRGGGRNDHDRDDRGGRDWDHRNDRGGGRNDHDWDDRGARNDHDWDDRGGQRYPRYPVYPVRPIYPVVRPVYPVYPVYPPYYAYRAYPGYYGYYGPHLYRGYYGDSWASDYGVVSSGRCNTDAVLGVAGAVTGAIIGNSSASEHRGIATVFGAIAGGIIGTAVGSAIDNGDRACFGHALELAPIGRPVAWTNPNSHIDWQVVPVRDVSRECREFDVRRGYSGRYGSERVTACRQGPGEWMFRS